MSNRQRISSLEERIEALETEANDDLKDIRQYSAWTPWGGVGGYDVKAPTLKAKVDAIINFLGLKVEAVDEETVDAHIEVTPAKPAKKPAKKKGKK